MISFILNKIMGVLITIQDAEGNDVGIFKAEDKKSFTQMAKANNISIATSCNAGACGMCKCKIIKGHDLVQTDKIMKPMGELKVDSDGKINVIFTCVAGVKSEYLNDDKNHEIVLRRNI